MLAYIERMNLQPRKLSAGQLVELVGLSHGLPEQTGSFAREKRKLLGEDVSIWRMELPNTSYRAPVAAFWCVSNERKDG